MRKSSKIWFLLIFLFLNVNFSNSLSYIELFGLENLVEDLVKAQPTTHYDGQESVSYAVDDKLLNFLKNFQTRTDFCDYKCPQFYQLTCFILFQCNIQIRNFFLIIICPIFTIAMIGLCCGRGIWTFSCWGRYIGFFTGIFFIIWFIKKIVKGYETIERRKREIQYMKQQIQKQDIDIEPVFTEKRLKQSSDS